MWELACWCFLVWLFRGRQSKARLFLKQHFFAVLSCFFSIYIFLFLFSPSPPPILFSISPYSLFLFYSFFFDSFIVSVGTDSIPMEKADRCPLLDSSLCSAVAGSESCPLTGRQTDEVEPDHIQTRFTCRICDASSPAQNIYGLRFSMLDLYMHSINL